MAKEGFNREKYKLWVSFYRANPHRFATQYLGIDLHLFQMILMYMLNIVYMFMYLASRGQGKSLMTSVYAVVRAILYPNSEIVIASGVRNQAKLIITSKIEKMRSEYPMVDIEIAKITTNSNECKVYFRNGSTIEAVTANDNTRGYRGHILLVDEFRLVSLDVIKKVLKPILSGNRTPPYLKKPEYKHLEPDENIEIYISSCWYRQHWMYQMFLDFKDQMIGGSKEYFVCGLPYTLSVLHKIMTTKRATLLRNELDDVTWMMEMDCLFFGELGNSFFSFDALSECRKLLQAWYPCDHYDYLMDQGKTHRSLFPKERGEKRIIGMDIALMGGNQNDNTVFTLVRLIPANNHYIRRVVYIETMNGVHAEKQAIRLKQLFDDFDADFVAMDTGGNGMAVYENCVKPLFDEDRNTDYPAWKAFNDEKMADRALSNYALPVIFSIKTNAKWNHEIALNFREAINKKTLELLTDDESGKNYIEEKIDANFSNKSYEEQYKFLKGHMQTTGLINEILDLLVSQNGGFVSVQEKSGKRKDRYCSIAYANHYASLLEAELRKGGSNAYQGWGNMLYQSGF